MELFRYRNLALGSCAFLVTLFFSYYINTAIRIAILALAGVAILLLILIYTIKHKKCLFNILCRFIPTLLFIALAMVIAILFFDKTKLKGYCDSKPHKITATVDEVIYQTSYMGYYELKLEAIDGESFNDKIKLNLYAKPLERGDIIQSTGRFYELEHSDLGFDEAGFLLSHGITIGFTSDNFEIIGFEEMPIRDFFERTNYILDNQFAKVQDDNTHAMLSALFLGNKDSLSNETKRDFSRIGLSHVLALSGMHITIIVTLLGYAIYFLPIGRIYKELSLILATFIFVGITGFSDSALRAGVMVCLVYTLFFFGSRTSLTSALFYSVSILCIIDPYSIFSLSLMLSFFAMLGCTFSAKIIHRWRFFRIFKYRGLRFITLTFISSVCACLFTLPLISVQFGTLAILSPISNIIIAPLFSLLIYLSPIFLMVANIPYVSVVIGWICTRVTELATYLGKTFSSFDDIVIPIQDAPQFISIIAFSACLILLLVLSRKYLLCFSIFSLCGLLVFISGTVQLYVKRGNNSYAGGYSVDNQDIVFVESKGELTIIDITSTNGSSYELASTVTSTLGYYEIDNYIITDYSSKTHIYFENLSSDTIVKNVYVPTPASQDENTIFTYIEAIARDKGVFVHLLTEPIDTNDTKITFSEKSYLPRSKKRAVAFTIECGDIRFTYLGASTFELCDYFPSDSAHLSDIIIFGAHGPNYKTKFSYSVPYLDYCVFFGDSISYATDEFYESIKDKISSSPRFLLTP